MSSSGVSSTSRSVSEASKTGCGWKSLHGPAQSWSRRTAWKIRRSVGHVIAIYRLDGCTQLLSQTQIGPQTVPIRLWYGLKIFCLNKQRRKAAAERVGHPGSRSDDTFIGRCCGKADQDMLPGPVPLSAPALLCIQSRPVRAAAKGKLPKRAQFGL